MTKNTEDLYREKAIMWADLPYRYALEFRIECAKDAMKYYRVNGREELAENGRTDFYDEMIEKFQDSEKAVGFNRKLLEELGDKK